MADGSVRVVVTLNVDRLVERALADAGVDPVVVSSADEVRGLPPLNTVRALVVHLHGDYRTAQTMKNTHAELAAYDAAVVTFMERLLHDHALVLVGWSATYDPALRGLLSRAMRQYFTSYWVEPGSLSSIAEDLRALKSIVTVRATADAALGALADAVAALRDREARHPMSTPVAVATAMSKRRAAREAIDIALQDPSSRWTALPRGLAPANGLVIDTPRPMERIDASSAHLGFSLCAFIPTPPGSTTPPPGSLWSSATRWVDEGDPVTRWLADAAPAWNCRSTGWQRVVADEGLKIVTARLESGASSTSRQARHPVVAVAQVSRSHPGPGSSPPGLFLVVQTSAWMVELDADRHPFGGARPGELLPAAMSPGEVAEMLDASLQWLLTAVQRSGPLLSPEESMNAVHLDVRSTGALPVAQLVRGLDEVEWREGATPLQLHEQAVLERRAVQAVARRSRRVTDQWLRRWLERAGAENPGVVAWR
ncbi:SIR2-like domain-containing protein [Quadrisphaera granulorum]|uniref:SIR2-like protein n=1 Tax=Quadrisphaera granulorum TaxID=317664 RepID=A0A316A5J1_9ACTN|nr:SIR2-like protein [Quadrisphaera granulorum]SZE97438.1 SIR2-like domain-containing protein [Quadrisphaera granulorum]